MSRIRTRLPDVIEPSARLLACLPLMQKRKLPAGSFLESTDQSISYVEAGSFRRTSSSVQILIRLSV